VCGFPCTCVCVPGCVCEVGGAQWAASNIYGRARGSRQAIASYSIFSCYARQVQQIANSPFQ